MQSEKRKRQRREAAKRWRAKQGPAKLKLLNRKWRDKAKQEVFDAYGNKCACCGETIREFLTIDHVNSDGATHRKTVGSGWGFYCWLKKHSFPKEYQILCWNCNCGRAVNGGVCPHTLQISQIPVL